MDRHGALLLSSLLLTGACGSDSSDTKQLTTPRLPTKISRRQRAVRQDLTLRRTETDLELHVIFGIKPRRAVRTTTAVAAIPSFTSV